MAQKQDTAQNQAFDAIYRAHHRAVLAYCARRTSRSNAWDATAEVFLVAWRRPDAVPSGDGALPWLFGVAYRTLANQRRSERRSLRLVTKLRGQSPADGTLDPERQVLRNEDEREVIDALGRLRPADREIITLALWEELPPVEIAKVLGISRAAVDKRFQRAKARLGEALPNNTADRATQIHVEEGGMP
ncbi:MAG: RNA polymerase sigma factor [Acidimicrobiia bacterium]